MQIPQKRRCRLTNKAPALLLVTVAARSANVSQVSNAAALVNSPLSTASCEVSVGDEIALPSTALVEWLS